MKKLLLLATILFFCPLFVHAQESLIEISPRIIDEKVIAGDLLKYTVHVKNVSDRKVDLYATVNDINQSNGEIDSSSPSDLDRDMSITRWLKFKRGVIELLPGAEVDVPLEINVSSTAKSGKYFSRIAFPNGSNRYVADSGMNDKSYAHIAINIEVGDNTIEKTQVKEFRSLKNVFLTSPATFMLTLNNFGNTSISPLGSIYIFNRRGEEVAKIDANEMGESIAPDTTWEKSINWEDLEGIGKFKARIELEYGEKDKRDLQDTVFFWVFPWKFLLFLFFITFVFLALMVTIIFRKTYKHNHYQENINEQLQDNQEDSDNGVINLKQ